MTWSAKSSTRTFIAILVLAFFAGCADDADKLLEEAGFHLDRAEYSQAETKARAVLAVDSTNQRASFVLASALIGQAFLSEGGSFLGLLADLTDDTNTSTGESDLETFARISPTFDETRFSQLEEARDVLIAIPAATKTADEFVLQFTARMFEVSTTLTRIGALNDDNGCNDDPSVTGFRDGIPDGLDASQLSTEQSARFRDNLDNAPNDANSAGLSDFELDDRIVRLSTALTDAIATTGNAQTGLQNFINEQFGLTGDATPCIIPI